MTTKTFKPVGARVGWTVPLGVTSVVIDAKGGSGGGDFASNGGAGSASCYVGGECHATIPVTPGTICYIRVGGNGDNFKKSVNQPLGGFPNGGNGTVGTTRFYGGAAGGGSTDFRYGSDQQGAQQVVAAGGGGTSANPDSRWDGSDATTSAGGAGGTHPANSSPQYMDPTLGQDFNGNGGGRFNGANAPDPNPISAHAPIGGVTYYDNPPSAGGGGGGYYGGGSGAWSGDPYDSSIGGRGGRGSSWITASATNTSINGVSLVGNLSSQPDGFLTLSYSLPPAAPATTVPFDHGNVDVTVPVEFDWQNAALPESGDHITGYEIQWRAVGDSDWTSQGHVTSTNTTTTIAANTFPPGVSIEWQVRSYGYLSGNAGPWSKSAYFTAISPPDAPNIEDPNPNDVISSSPVLLDWAGVTGQQSWEARRVADDGSGNPNAATVYWDSGIFSNASNSVEVPFTAATRNEHVQVRVQVNGLWSGWADVEVSVAISPPQPPTLTATPNSDTASITVVISNPPHGALPAADHNDLYRSDPEHAEIRVATGLPVNGTWIDRTPAHGIVYTYRAVAVAANGAGQSS